jgi:hypothetical protein
VRTRFEASIAKRNNVKKEEELGNVADSGEVRLKLMKRVRAGEITLAEAQQELKKIKRNAKKNGQITRSQAFNKG